jgi:hypothetical protein
MIDPTTVHAQLAAMCASLQASIDADMDLHARLCKARDSITGARTDTINLRSFTNPTGQ